VRRGKVRQILLNAETEVGPRHLQAALHFNAVVPFELSRRAVPELLKRPGASTTNICSDIVGKQMCASPAYHTGKAAEAQVTLSMATALVPNTRVDAVFPARVETGKFREYLQVKIPELREALSPLHAGANL
jgi:7-alpha-hydroxysteroid dehydrogenase